MRTSKKTTTQEQFARLVGTTQATISELSRSGVLTPDGTLLQWIREYTAHLREIAAGRLGEDRGINLVDERARLAKAMREKIQLDILKTRGEFRSIKALSMGINFIHGAIRAKLLSLPSRFRSSTPGVAPAQYTALDALVREILTELANTRAPSEVARQMVDIDQADFERIEVIGNGNGTK